MNTVVTHGPTPWTVFEGHTRIWIKDANGNNVTDPCIGSLQERADLARIVASVNACDGFSTEALEILAKHARTAIKATVDERDALRAALQTIAGSGTDDGAEYARRVAAKALS